MTKFTVKTEKFLGDTFTPVNLFLRLRQRYSEVLLLESADYRGSENSLSFICVQPLLKFVVSNGRKETHDYSKKSCDMAELAAKDVLPALLSFISSVELSDNSLPNGFFGYCSYDAVKYFEDIELKADNEEARSVPEIRYAFYRFVIIFNHFTNQIYLLENCSSDDAQSQDRREQLKQCIAGLNPAHYPFQLEGAESSNLTDEEHAEIIVKCKAHVARGDVFQIVPSRRFMQGFKGDEFNVYRVLRSINPSPYLFYFDYGDYRMFGSSPEAQIAVKKGMASIYPIAGTYPRSADRANDHELAETLSADPKENAEHVMLVDLARNDLSKHCKNVRVDVYKEVQFYSHVIHLVSKVDGELEKDADSVSVLADTFPAGTLSGAPKYRAMELIDRYEKGNRGIYGGCVGLITAAGDILHAIIIRSFLSKNNKLFYQAGGGVVFDSDVKAEVNEVKNKLGALKQALIEAEKLC